MLTKICADCLYKGYYHHSPICHKHGDMKLNIFDECPMGYTEKQIDDALAIEVDVDLYINPYIIKHKEILSEGYVKEEAVWKDKDTD